MTEQANHSGLFVAFEGGDGAGKSTQLELLAEALRGRGETVVTTREPGGTELGERIRDLLLSAPGNTMGATTEALLFAAARAQHVEEKILPALAQGAVVLSDRFVDSSIAYQGGARGLGLDAVQQLNAWATGGTVPDVTILLDVTVDLSLTRRQQRQQHDGGVQDRIEAEPDSFHAELTETFRHLAAQQPERYMVLDASQSVGVLAAQILTAVQERLP